MKKAFLRILSLLLGLNVFTACYGPALPPNPETLEKEHATLQEPEDVEEEAAEETVGEGQQ